MRSRLFSYLLCLSLALSLTCCSTRPSEVPAGKPAQEQQAPAEEEITSQVNDMLDSICSHHPGSAGAQLRLYQAAFRLLNYSEQYDDSQQPLLTDTVSDYLSQLDQQQLEYFRSTLQEIQSVADTLFSNGIDPMLPALADAGNPQQYEQYSQQKYETVFNQITQVLENR